MKNETVVGILVVIVLICSFGLLYGVLTDKTKIQACAPVCYPNAIHSLDRYNMKCICDVNTVVKDYPK